MITPIKPCDVEKAKAAIIPEEVINIFNELIARYWDGFSSVIQQDTAIKCIEGRMNITRGEIFDRHLLDIEDTFRNVGWIVEYDKPGYNESYPATFTFKRK